MPLADNLYKYWKLDGTNYDEVSFTNNLTLVNGLGYNTGKINQCLDFNSYQRHAIFNPGTAWGISSAFTLNFWVKFNQLGTEQGLLVRDDVYTGGGRSFQLAILSNNRMRFVTFNSSLGVTSMDSSATFSLGVWYMITATFDINGMKLYINATLDNFFNYNSNTNDPTNAKLGIGTFTDSGVWYLVALMDEIGIWAGKALSASEITQLYNGGSGLQYPFGATSTQNSGFLMFM